LFIVKVWPVIDPAHPLSIVGFLGISYVTFKVVSTLMEIRDGLIKELPLKEFLYFLYFYPTISSGPIDRFRRFKKDLDKPVDPQKYVKLLKNGIQNIFQGFLYNFIIGYFIQHLWLHRAAIIFTRTPDFSSGLSATYAYGLYLFFNFAGYSLFAVGVSQLMGVETPMNFNKPFLAKNIKDFWNRWHMTLCNWFRDFVFMRLVKTMMTKKFTKSMITMSVIANLALFGLMGFWHGFAWFYIVYGFYHASLMIGYEAWDRFKKKHKLKIPNVWWTKGLSIFITLQFVLLGFLIFSGLLNNMIMYHATLDRLFIPNF
ncbi:MAG: D-alanyl-lipoteichoic acid biosynthesis protein DltB, partial [Streptococcaceae bacterium]|nr:D-alanyl-lipoteichoic acid biosynthesis protein DltB [Streptococcaceae bacterium]